MLQYDLHVSVSPEKFNGELAHMWRITQTNEDGTFTVAHGYATHFEDAVLNAQARAIELKLV